jgi:SAM-dependent methyltransferase
LANVEGPFDVVLAGDVLEHLVDPRRVLADARSLLAPGGYVVASVPNVAHVDVRMALLCGRFAYRETGLLDATHLRFFTHDTLLELFERAGLAVARVRRVRHAPFTTEIVVDPAEIPPDALRVALEDPEAETYQFVVVAVPVDTDAEGVVAAMGRDLDALTVRAERLDELAASREIEVAALREERDELLRELDALRATRTFRYSASLRSLYGRLRGR